MARKPSLNPRRTFAALLVTTDEQALVAQALEIARASLPGFAEVSVNALVREATLAYCQKIVAEYHATVTPPILVRSEAA